MHLALPFADCNGSVLPLHLARSCPCLCRSFNRTGFVLASYLVEVCGQTVEQALDAFGEARPPGEPQQGGQGYRFF
jgi:hypothetical protein